MPLLLMGAEISEPKLVSEGFHQKKKVSEWTLYQKKKKKMLVSEDQKEREKQGSHTTEDPIRFVWMCRK